MPQKQPTVLQQTMAQVSNEAGMPPNEESLLPETPPAEAEQAPTDDEGTSDADIKEFDQKQIEIALTSLEELQEAVNAKGSLFMTVNGVRGYKVDLSYGADQLSPEQQNVVSPQGNAETKKRTALDEVFVFVWSKPNRSVIEFLVQSAQSNNYKKILGFVDHAMIVSEYRW